MKNTEAKKTSIANNSAWMAVLHAAIILSQTILIIKRQITFTSEDFLGPIYIPLLISIICLIFLIVIAILAFKQSKHKEKEDELANQNRYKAGYISKYILTFVIIIAIFFIKDFRFAFTGDFIDNIITLPLIIFCFSEFVQHIVFIFLEKYNLE